MYNRYPSSIKITSDDIGEKLDKLSANKQLTPYDSNLIASFSEFHKTKGYLSDRQYALLNKVYEANSPERGQLLQDFRDNFTKEMRENLRICCEYYEKTGYFSNVVSQWKKDPDFIPTPEQYEKICNNTYAKKVLENHTRPTQFSNGDLVQTRAGYSLSAVKYVSKGSVTAGQCVGSTVYFVVDNKVVGNELHRYCKVFPMTAPDSIFLIREKDLKKYKAGK